MPNCPFIPAPKSPPKIILQIPPPITVPPRYGGSTGGIHCSGSLPTPCPPSRPRPQQVVQNCHFLLFDSSHGSPVHVCFNKKPKCKPCTAYKSLFIEKSPQNTNNISAILRNYTYTFNSCMVDSSLSSAWAALFTPICEITYPFCTGIGRDGLANFAMEAELGVYNMMVGLHCCVCHSHWMSCQYYPRVIILLLRARLQGSIFGKSHS